MPILGIVASGADIVGGAYESIASATGTGSSGTITFSSIPADYQHLQIRAITRTSTGTGTAFNIRLNNDTGSNYASHQLYGDGSSTGAAGTASESSITNGGGLAFGSSITADMLGVSIVDIHDYANTSKYTTTRTFSGRDNNSTNGFIRLGSGLWMNTNAVNQIDLISTSGNFTTQTVFALYGIKAA